MNKKSIVVYDDDPKTQEGWKRRLLDVAAIKRNFDVICVTSKDLLIAVAALEQRRAQARTRSSAGIDLSGNYFDKVDILVIDYDLLKAHEEGTSLTGEGIAYLARCYSGCGLILALNQFGNNVFDLTLKGHPESYADLNVGSFQVDNPGLWSEPWAGFRPWCWPLVPRYLDAFEARSKELLDHLDSPILDYLGFTGEIVNTLSRSVLEFLEGKKRKHGGSPTTITFRDFVVTSGNALRPKDKPFNDEAIARIAAARVEKWLERLVLPGQDILVDGPHLVSRYPSLLKGNKKKVEVWNKSATLQGVPNVIHHELIEKFRFKKNNWLSRAAWFWNQVSNLEKITEVGQPWSPRHADLVFSEDLSSFLPRKSTLEFVADMPSPFVRRFVANPTVVPARRNVPDVKGVNYRPEVRFSL